MQLESTSGLAELSYDDVVEVLTPFHFVKETGCGIQTKLEQLQLKQGQLQSQGQPFLPIAPTICPRSSSSSYLGSRLDNFA